MCALPALSQVETQAVLRAGTVVPPGCVIPSGQMWAGNPAQYVRDLSADELMELPKIAESIRETAAEHADQPMPESSVHDQAAELRKQMAAARASSSSSLKVLDCYNRELRLAKKGPKLLLSTHLQLSGPRTELGPFTSDRIEITADFNH